MRSFFTFATGTKDRPPLPVHLASSPNPRSRTRSRLDSLTLTTLPVPPLAHPRSRRTSNPARNSARGRTRTRGADIDVGGRRLPADGISEKDILPAYGEEAAGGRLPLYVELEAMDFGRGVGADGGEARTPTQDEPPVGEGFMPSSDVERQHGSQPSAHTEPTVSSTTSHATALSWLADEYDNRDACSDNIGHRRSCSSVLLVRPEHSNT